MISRANRSLEPPGTHASKRAPSTPDKATVPSNAANAIERTRSSERNEKARRYCFETDVHRYSKPISILAQLQDHKSELPPVRLLRSSWVLAQADLARSCQSEAERAAYALPRRQELEARSPHAYYSAREVRAVRQWRVRLRPPPAVCPTLLLHLSGVRHLR